MMLQQSFKLALQSVFSNKLRTFLTMLGMIIGVASLIVLVSIVNGATNSVTDSISQMGNNLLTIQIQDDKNNPYTLSEVMELSDDSLIGEVAPFTQENVTVKKERTSSSMTTYATTADYDDIQKLTLTQGRFLSQADVNNRTYVAVLNATAAETLFSDAFSAVGQTVSINGYTFTVIGVLEEKEQTVGNTSERLEAYIPFSILSRIGKGTKTVSSFYLTAKQENDIDRLEKQMTRILYSRFSNDTDAFTVTNNSTLLDTMSSVNDTMKWMLGGIAAISLLVGGIGIMNIMLVSVTERTREIGIRKAIGARRRTILIQFLMEALIVSITGCLLGIIFSLLIVFGINHFTTTLTASISSGVVLIALTFSIGIGIIFGSYPAYKAANKKPIDALRYTL